MLCGSPLRVSSSKIGGSKIADRSDAVLSDSRGDVERQVLDRPLRGHMLVICGTKAVVRVPVLVSLGEETK